MTKHIDEINIGDGATLCVGSDRYPATVVAKTRTTVIIQRDNYTPAPGYEYYGNQIYTYTPDPEATTCVVRLTKRGWRSNGTPISFTGRSAYSDPHF